MFSFGFLGLTGAVRPTFCPVIFFNSGSTPGKNCIMSISQLLEIAAAQHDAIKKAVEAKDWDKVETKIKAANITLRMILRAIGKESVTLKNK